MDQAHSRKVYELLAHPNRNGGCDAIGDITTVTVHISKLRDKIESAPSKPQ